jgi:hypothetical protein
MPDEETPIVISMAEVEQILAPVLTERDRLIAEVKALQTARRRDARTMGRLESEVARLQAELAQLRPPAPPLALARPAAFAPGRVASAGSAHLDGPAAVPSRPTSHKRVILGPLQDDEKAN